MTNMMINSAMSIAIIITLTIRELITMDMTMITHWIMVIRIAAIILRRATPRKHTDTSGLGVPSNMSSTRIVVLSSMTNYKIIIVMVITMTMLLNV